MSATVAPAPAPVPASTAPVPPPPAAAAAAPPALATARAVPEPSSQTRRLPFTIQTTDHTDTKLDVPSGPDMHMGTVVTENEFTGGLEGSGTAAYVMLFLPTGAEMAYVSSFKLARVCKYPPLIPDGQLVFNGAIDGRRGTVVFRVTGNCLAGINMRLKVIPESATGELRGIHGEGWYASDSPETGGAEGRLEVAYY